MSSGSAGVAPLLLERDLELAACEETRDAALAGHGSLLILEGTAGIGKTRLLEAIARRALAADMTVLSAGGGELERRFAYGVVRQLFEGALAELPATRRRSLLSGAAAMAAPALGHGAGQGVRSSAPRESFAITHGLYWLIANLAAESPLTLTIDDAQWADQPSLHFLVYLARRLEELPVVVIVATWPNEPEGDRELLAQLVSTRGTRILRPQPLSRVAVADVLRREFGTEPDESFVDACHRTTGGNPFYVRDLTAAVRAEGIHPTADAEARIRDVRPDSLSRAILLRLSRLPPAAKPLARAVAVFGGHAEMDNSARLAGLDASAAAEAADALARADIFSASRQLAFIHSIVRTVVYADIPPAERAQRHGLAARLLGAADAPADQVAEQLLNAEPSADEWVVQALRAGARAALDRGAPAIAAERLRRALAEPPASGARAELLRDLALAEFRAGQTESALQRCQQALDREPDPCKRAETAVLMRNVFAQAGRATECIALLDRAREDVSEFDPELARELETGVLAAAQLGIDADPALAERIGSLRRRVEKRSRTADPWARAVVALGFAFTGERPAQEVGDLAQQAAEQWFTPSYRGREQPRGPLLQALILSERFEVADSILEQTKAEARRRGWLPMLRAALAFAASSAYRQGALADAEVDARAATALASEQGERWFASLSCAALLQTLIERAELAQAQEALDDLGFDPSQERGLHATWLLHARGQLRCAEGRTAEGLKDLRESGARFERHLAPCPTVAPWRADAALAGLALGDAESASRLIEDELERARAFAAPRTLGIALRTAGLVHGGVQGIECLEEAVTVLEHSQARLEHAHALVELGAALRRTGRRLDARPPLRKGRDIAHACGSAKRERQATEELVASGTRPRSLMVLGRDSLTPSEARIAKMAASGLATRDIAQSLFVTSRTVENHLARIYQKLGIHSRKELRAGTESELAEEPS